jgi:vanillate O-demethylase monooxygenase subunit
MGDPALADPTRSPISIGRRPQLGAKAASRFRANWQLVVDNLLDLTHLAFVHRSPRGRAGRERRVGLTRTPNDVVVTR